MRKATIALTALAAALCIGAAAQAAWPEKPVTFVVPWPAGGTTDIYGRLLADAMSKQLGQPVAVINKVGGGGALGTKMVIDAPKDGYTVLVTTTGNQMLTPLKGNVGYQPTDLEPIGQVSSRTLALVAGKDAPWNSLADLVEDARAHPGKYTFGAVKDVLPHLAVKQLAKAAGIELTHVPQQGDAPGVTALLGGHVDLLPASLESVKAHIESGAMKPLAVFNEERDPQLPKVPTASEQGYDVVANPWTGLAVAKGTAEPAVATLRTTLARVADDPDFRRTVEKSGSSVEYLDAQSFGQVWTRDFARFKEALQQ